MLLWILPLLAFGMALHWLIERSLLTEIFESELAERSKVLASLVTAQRGAIELGFADEYTPEYSLGNGPYFFQVWLPSGATLERSKSLGDMSLPLRVGSVGQPTSFDGRGPDGSSLRCVGTQFPRRSGSLGDDAPAWIDVVVAARSGLLEARLREGLWEVIWGGILSAVAVALAIFLALRQGIVLIEGVVQTVESIDPAHLDRPVLLATVPREIQPIVKALNRSLGTTSAVLEQERSFNANVAHELRTPISELRTTTDVALRFPELVDPHEALQEANEVARTMGRTVEALLRLSRLQSHVPEEEAEPFDLVPVIQEAFLGRAEAGHDIERTRLDLPARCEVRSGAAPWALIINNLAENALEHSPTGSLIEVRLTSAAGTTTFSVRNSAPQLTRDDLEHLTERLWRGRGEAGRSAHSGLGLSIVAAACSRLGARLSFELSDGELLASVSLPASPTTAAPLAVVGVEGRSRLSR
jgi:two-component system sensor histidine kinase QseC